MPRILVGTSDGSFHCVKDALTLWSLEESLTETVCSLFADALDHSLTTGIDGKQDGSAFSGDESVSGSLLARFSHRVQRHFSLFSVC